MGQKVNFNKKNNKLKIAVAVILGLLIVIILVVSVRKRANNNTPQNTINTNDNTNNAYVEFKTLEDLLESYGCKLISNDESSGLSTINLTFKYDLYSGNDSNENYFSRLCNAVAIFEGFNNVTMKDSAKDITIEITCNGARIVEIKINGDANYYQNKNSEKNKNLSYNITNFTIQSSELQALIKGNWQESKVDWGTRESVCNGYNIYFDEGIKYKTVATKVFNVVFTNKYTGEVAGTLKTSSNKAQVENALGKPTFSDSAESVYGYVGPDNYLFFDFQSKQISVYPIVKVSEDEENKLKELINSMNELEDVKKFVSDLTMLWTDYDYYEYDSYYVDLRYTLKGFGISIDSRSLENGIYIYQNYSGDRDITEIEGVYLKSTDFVYESELNRANYEFLNRNEQGDFTDEELKEMGVKFAVRARSTENGIARGIQLYSRDFEEPDVELNKNLEVSSWKWYDDYNFIYSVNGDGIYVYNCERQTDTKLADIDESTIIINSVTEDKIVYNETEEIGITN